MSVLLSLKEAEDAGRETSGDVTQRPASGALTDG